MYPIMLHILSFSRKVRINQCIDVGFILILSTYTTSGAKLSKETAKLVSYHITKEMMLSILSNLKIETNMNISLSNWIS